MKWQKQKVYWVKGDDKQLLAEYLCVCKTLGQRLKGLMFKKFFYRGKAILLTPCNSIHTFFVRFPLDIIYLDKEMRVIRVTKNIKPWRIDRPVWGAKHVLELPAGTIINEEETGQIVLA